VYRVSVVGGEPTYEVDGSTDLCAGWTAEEAQALPLVGLAKLEVELAFPCLRCAETGSPLTLALSPWERARVRQKLPWVYGHTGCA
jgi:hypothetical protein